METIVGLTFLKVAKISKKGDDFKEISQPWSVIEKESIVSMGMHTAALTRIHAVL